MTEPAPPTAVLLTDRPDLADEWRGALGSAGFVVVVRPLASAASGADFLLLDGYGSGVASGRELFRRWRAGRGECYLPAVAMIPDVADSADWLRAGADACLALPVDPGLLAAQGAAVARQLASAARLTERAGRSGELDRQLRTLYGRAGRDLELTARLARRSRPDHVPDVGHVRVGVCHRPRSRIGGDSFDVIALGEQSLAIFLADAMCRGGITGGLVGVLARETVASRTGGRFEPDEVLRRLDGELSSLGGDEPTLLSMVCCRIDCVTGQVTLARAAAPPPLYLPAADRARYWDAPGGPFVGTCHGDFPPQVGHLSPGDLLLFASDGVRPGDDPDAARRLKDVASRHRGRDVRSFVDRLAAELLDARPAADDFTLIAVRFGN